MLRDIGQLILPANIERNIAAPLDASMRVHTKAALTNPFTFTAPNDSISYAYVGMFTSVIDDEIESNNGLYILTKLPTTDSNNWVKLQNTTDASLTTNSKDITGAINELDEQIGNYDSPNSTNIVANTQTVMFWNSTDAHLALPESSFEKYEMDICFITYDNDTLTKHVSFVATTRDTVQISDAFISDTEKIGANDFFVDVDLEQAGNDPRIVIYANASKDCTGTIFLTRKKTLI